MELHASKWHGMDLAEHELQCGTCKLGQDSLTPSPELFYLHIILQCCPTTSFVDAQTMNLNSHTFDSYQVAAIDLGISANEQEAEHATLTEQSDGTSCA